jgi:hypothetical protein
MGIDLGTTIKLLRGTAGIGLGTTAKYLRRLTSGAAGNGLRTTAKYLRGAAGIGLGTTINYPATHNERRSGQQPGNHDQVSREPKRGRGVTSGSRPTTAFRVFVSNTTDFRKCYRRIPPTLSSSIRVTIPVALKMVSTMLRSSLSTFVRTDLQH